MEAPGDRSTAGGTAGIVPTMDEDGIRAELTARREDLMALRESSAESRKVVTLDQQSVGRLSRMDALQGQAMAKAAEERRMTEIVRIDAALKRLDAGTYGECLRCGDEIEPGRLAVDPTATLCLGCAKSG